MADLKFQPVPHEHGKFLEKAGKRRGFKKTYAALEPEYALAKELLAARTRAGLTQEVLAERMGTTKSAISRLEAVGGNPPSVSSLQRYAAAVGCTLKIELIPSAAKSRVSPLRHPGLRKKAA